MTGTPNTVYGKWVKYLFEWRLDYPDQVTVWDSVCAAIPTVSTRTLLRDNFRLIEISDGVAVIGGWSRVLINIADAKKAEILAFWPEATAPESIVFRLELME